MAKVCMVTGKGTARGNHVAHCNKKMKRTFQTNVHWKRFWLADENRFISLRVSARGMRTIDKKGIEAVLAELRNRGEQV
ncbi:50S ribosomal protein L28 [Candidatus Berkiella aquae]|uniref:Large ribosomal subunit protein bL28 n=1 Tax=Candidatus Berkiella aquae TaxID=295108 RepID=A0A0Q9YK06_9GAMM|nr:50S ribosomal protein L28 [Candidatus Berkiella aquae]MCS5710048.1 50S ribosomal protein L28 [Candidatus Berkiella aquae]